MGFLDKFKKKADQATDALKEKDPTTKPEGRRIKKYTSDGKPVYE